MSNSHSRARVAAFVAAALFVTPPAFADPATPPLPDAAQLHQMTARFAPTPLKVELAGLPDNEIQALAKIIEAARLMDGIFLRQRWAGATTRLLELAADDTPLGRERLHAFRLNKGPWLQIDHDRPFVPHVPAKPEAGNFYPAGSSKADIETWLKTLGDVERRAATDFFTTIRRGPDGNFRSVPYSIEYQGELAEAARLLREAAAVTRQPSLQRFLEARAASFLSNDYHASDIAWMELDSSIEPTIGPYEVYEDGWFGAKAAFESFVGLRDEAETKKLEKMSGHLQALEDALPIAPALRNPKLGALAPIRVVNQIFSSGDANHGVQTAAYNLPNDERIIAERGTKRVMLKNVQQAKFERTLLPIAGVALAKADRGKVRFDVFFTHILMHELMHGLGPHAVTGQTTTVREALQEAGGALEEAKADITGLWAMQQLIDKGVLPREMEQSMYTTFLASSFRTLRFGLNEAHGKGQALQLNTLLDAGAVKVAADGTFSVVAEKIKAAVTALSAEILELQASGDAAKARQMLAARATLRPEVKLVLDRLTAVPVDIEPVFVSADALRGTIAK